jgi:ketosteroid isomerase-like protein
MMLPPFRRSGLRREETRMASVDFEEAIQEARAALEMIIKGDAEGYKALLSASEEVTLANPFGGIAHGRDDVIETLDRAASNFRDGHATGFEEIEWLVTPDLAYTLEIERFVAKVGGSSELSDIALRVSCMYRLEDGGWKLLHRRADPRVGPQTPESLIQG